jgi:hypothetical protein
MKPLNRYVKNEMFCMETASRVAETMSTNSWACSLDLTDAYQHIPMHDASQRYIRFTHDNVAYQFRALPFGVNVSAWVFYEGYFGGSRLLALSRDCCFPPTLTTG